MGKINRSLQLLLRIGVNVQKHIIILFIYKLIKMSFLASPGLLFLTLKISRWVKISQISQNSLTDSDYQKELLEIFMGINNDFSISAKNFTSFCAFKKKAILPFSDFVKLRRHISQQPLIRHLILRPFWKSHQIPLFSDFHNFLLET